MAVILFCHLLNDHSGSPVVLGEAIRALGQTYSDRVLFVGSQGRGCLEAAGVPIHRYWYRRSRFRIVTLVTYLGSQLMLYRALTRAKVPREALLYVNTLLPFAAAIWGHRTRRLVIYHLHEVSVSPNVLRRFLLWVVERTAHKVIYVSDDHRQRLPVNDIPFAVIPNPVAKNIATRGFATLYSPRRSGYFEALMLASPRDFKGVPEFIELARRVALRDEIRFTLVLNGSCSEIASYLADRNVPSNVVVHARTAVPEEFYAVADVLFNLSRVDKWIETFGLTIVEGMAFGLPTIVPPVGGPAAIVTDEVDGYLVDSREMDELEHRLLTLVDNPRIALVMSEAARRRARSFTFETFSGALQEQIECIIAGSTNGKT